MQSLFESSVIDTKHKGGTSGLSVHVFQASKCVNCLFMQDSFEFIIEDGLFLLASHDDAGDASDATIGSVSGTAWHTCMDTGKNNINS